MTSELILMADVKGLGSAGAIVKVADGYARNYLIPHKLAAPVTAKALRQLEKNRQQREALLKQEQEAAQELAASIEQASCTIAVKVGENGKLFGAVTAADISEALVRQNLQVDKHRVCLDEPIRDLGVYTIKIKLHAAVEASLKVWVVEE